jgi:putative ABC transport system permease protein
MNWLIFFIEQQFRLYRERPGRALLFFLSIVVGVSLSLAIQSINTAIVQSFRDDVDALSGKATLTLSGDQTGFPEEILDEVEKIEGVKAAVPMVEAFGYPDLENAGVLTVLGVDLLKEGAIRSYQATDQRVIDDPLLFLNQSDSVILTIEYAAKYHLKIDSKFSILTEKGPRVLTVRGLLKPEGPAKAFGGSVAIMDIDGARVIFGKQGRTDHIDLLLRKGSSEEVVTKRLKDYFGTRVSIDRPQARSEETEKMTKGFQLMIAFFGQLALLVAFFMIYNTMKISVAERIRETALLRILGASSRSIFWSTLVENGWIGLMAGATGTFISQYMSRAVLGDVLTSMTGQFGTYFSAKILPLTLNDWLMGLGLGASATFLGGLLPALQAARTRPLEAFRSEEKESVDDHSSPLQKWTLGLCILGVAWVFLKKNLGLLDFLAWTNSIDFVIVVLSAGALAPLLFIAFLKLVSRLPVLPPLLRFSIESLVRSAKSTRSYLSSVSFSVILILLIHLLSSSFKYSITSWLDILLKDHLYVSSAGGNLQRYLVQPLNQDLMGELEAIPGVQHVAGARAIHAKVLDQSMMIKAFYPPDPSLDYQVFDLQDGNLSEIGPQFFNGSEPSILISTNMAKKHKLLKGGRLPLYTPLNGEVSFKILGLVTDFGNPNGTIYVSKTWYQKFWGDTKISAFSVRIKDGFPQSEVRSEIERRMGQKYRVVTYLASDLRSDLLVSVDKSFQFTKAVELCALLLTFLTLFSTFSISLLLKTREFMLLRAIGMTKEQLMLVNLIEALLQGAVGSFMAVALGAFASMDLIRVNLAELLGWPLKFHFDTMICLRTILLITGVSVIAAMIPAFKLSRLKATSSSIGQS